MWRPKANVPFSVNLYFLRQSSSLNVVLTDWLDWTGQSAPGIHLSPLSSSGVSNLGCHSCSSKGPGTLKSDPHVHMAKKMCVLSLLLTLYVAYSSAHRREKVIEYMLQAASVGLYEKTERHKQIQSLDGKKRAAVC